MIHKKASTFFICYCLRYFTFSNAVGRFAAYVFPCAMTLMPVSINVD